MTLSRTRRADVLAVGLLGTLFAVFFAGPILRGETLTHRDLGSFFAPLREITFREVFAGRFPLWNVHSLSGLPLFSDPNVALLSPFSWLYPIGGVTLLVLAEGLAIPLVGFWLLRKSGFPVSASILGASTVGFGGITLSVFPLITVSSTFSLIPLVAFLVHRLAVKSADGVENARRSLAVAGAAIAVLLLSGEPASSAEGLLLIAAVGLVPLVNVWRDPTRRKRVAASLLLAGLLALCLASVQILPTVRQLSRSARGEGLDAATGPLYWSLPPSRLGALLVPDLYGDPLAEKDEDDWSAPLLEAGGSYVPYLYVGLLPLALLPAAFSRSLGKGCVAVAGLGALLSLGRYTPLGPWLLRLIPPMRLIRYPEKWLLFVALSLALASAVGFASIVSADEVESARARRRLLWAVSALALFLALGGIFLSIAPGLSTSLLVRAGIAAPPFASHAASILKASVFLGAVVAAALAGAALLLRDPSRRPIAIALLIGMALADLLRVNGGLVPSSENNPYRTADPVVRQLANTAAGHPVYYEPVWKGSLAAIASRDAGGYDAAMPLTGIFHGLRYAGNNEVDRMGPRHAVRWAAQTSRLPWGPTRLRRLERAGVTAIETLSDLDWLSGLERVVTPGSETAIRRIYRLRNSRPETMIASHGIRVSTEGEMDLRLDGGDISDPATTVVSLGGNGNLEGEGRVVSSNLISPLEEDHDVDIVTSALFFRARTFDPDFECTIDGKRTNPTLADGMFTAVEVPAGRHRIHFRYRNPALIWGALVSMLGVGAAVVLSIPRANRRKE